MVELRCGIESCASLTLKSGLTLSQLNNLRQIMDPLFVSKLRNLAFS